MKKRFGLAISFCLVLRIGASAQDFSGIDFLRDFVGVGQFAFGMMPPKALVSNVTHYELDSKQSRIVCVVSEPSVKGSGPKSVVIVALKSGTIKTQLKVPDDSQVIANWLGNRHLLITVEQKELVDASTGEKYSKYRVMRVNVDTGASEAIFENTNFPLYVQVHPFSPLALIHTPSHPFIAGVNGRPLAVQEPFTAIWNGDRPALTKQNGGFFEVDPETLALKEGTVLLDQVKSPEVPGKLFIERLKAVSANGVYSKPRWENWLASDGPDWPTRALASSDGSASLLDDHSGVLILSNGTLSFRKIEKVNLKEFANLVEAAERRELMSYAKQCGLGILLYGADNEDSWPPTAGFTDALKPYLKDASVMGSFEFLRPSKGMIELDEPAKTPIGQIVGRSGKAVVYADGHVKWESK